MTQVTLKAANGLDIPYSGVVIVDLELLGQKCEGVPVLVVKDSSDPSTRKKKAADVSRLWGPKHQVAFDSLKGALTTAPVLGYADYTKPFILEMDASHDGLSAVLSQEQDGKSRELAFASHASDPLRKTVHSTAAWSWSFLPWNGQ